MWKILGQKKKREFQRGNERKERREKERRKGEGMGEEVNGEEREGEKREGERGEKGGNGRRRFMGGGEEI